MRIQTPLHDNRKAYRFPIQHELRFKLLKRGRIAICGTGRTLNISSGGVSFEADPPLPVGALVELSINWPALLDDKCPIRLIVLGRVVRADQRVAVCKLTRYDFRTQARNGRATTAVAADAVLRQWALAAG